MSDDSPANNDVVTDPGAKEIELFKLRQEAKYWYEQKEQWRARYETEKSAVDSRIMAFEPWASSPAAEAGVQLTKATIPEVAASSTATSPSRKREAAAIPKQRQRLQKRIRKVATATTNSVTSADTTTLMNRKVDLVTNTATAAADTTAIGERKKSEPSTVRKARKYQLCKVDGCVKFAKRGGICVAHGAVRVRCKSLGCANIAQKGGVCTAHGAVRVRCKMNGCIKGAVKGGVCVAHGAVLASCKMEGCSNKRQQGGVCIAHGAVKKRCSTNGCVKVAKKGGFCATHGLRTYCSTTGCRKIALNCGVCRAHGADTTACQSKGAEKNNKKEEFAYPMVQLKTVVV